MVDYTTSECAWFALEYLIGHTQKNLGKDFGYTNGSTINLCIAAFCYDILKIDTLPSHPVKRKRVIVDALRKYDGTFEQPTKRAEYKTRIEYKQNEHDNRNRQIFKKYFEGFTYKQLGKEFNLSPSRISNIIWRAQPDLKLINKLPMNEYFEKYGERRENLISPLLEKRKLIMQQRRMGMKK